MPIRAVRRFTKVIVMMMLTGASMQASVIYDFVGTAVDGVQQAFNLTVPDFINPLPTPPNLFVFFTCAQLNSSTNCTGSDGVGFGDVPSAGAFSAEISILTGNTVYPYAFPTGAFGAPGVYTAIGSNGDNGTLTITGTPISAPEPTTILLILSGGVLLFPRLRRLAK